MLLVVAATDRELEGVPSRHDVEPLACGVGPVDAGIAVARRLSGSGPQVDAVLHVGIAGARRDTGFEPGHLVLGATSRYCDTDSHLVARELEPDPVLLADLHRALPDAPVLAIGTSASVGGTTGCDVEAMEGFAVLRAAQLAGVPAIEVRVISNEVEEDDRSRWFFDEALEALRAALPELVSAIASPA